METRLKRENLDDRQEEAKKLIAFPQMLFMMLEDDERSYMERLYEKNQRLMFFVAWQYVQDKMFVEDIVSDACLAIMKNLDTIRQLDEYKVKAYIASTVHNIALNCVRVQDMTNKRFRSIDDVEEGTFDENPVETKVFLQDEIEQMIRAINQLPQKEQAVLQMKCYLHKSDKEIANTIGISETSVRKYVSRARNKLRDEMYAD